MNNNFDSPHDAPDHALRQARRARSENDQAVSEFLKYWKGMRREGDVPRRSDIDPRGIESLLSNAFIVERIAPGLARMRIAGSHLSDLMGMEVRGMPLSAFFNAPHRDTLSHALVQVFDAPATLRIDITSRGGPGAPALTGELVVLPLRSDLGDVSRALGCLVTTGTIGRGPRRFDIDALHCCDIDLGQRVPVAPATQAPPALTGFSAPPTAPLRPSERPYLRLVKTD